MLFEKKLNMKHLQKGVTLIELMISIVLGLLLLGAATAMTVKRMVMNGDTLNSVKLNQDLDSVVQVMVNDMRRAGYAANITAGGADVVFADLEDLNIVSASCVLYAYNLNGDNVLDANEKYGFRLTGSEIEMRTGCTATGTTCSTSCNAGTWAPLTDDTRVTISSLTFDTLNSKCLSITDTDNVVNLSNRNNYWVTTTVGTTQFPCMASSGTGLTTYVLDASKVYNSGTFVAPQSDDRLIGARQVNVKIVGALTNDATMRKSQLVAINVRNNHVRVIP